MEEILNVQAHDSEILCLEFSQPDTGEWGGVRCRSPDTQVMWFLLLPPPPGLRLLATAGRDRLIHVLDAGRGYVLVQTLDEHSSSITSVRFTCQFLSCDFGVTCPCFLLTSTSCVTANQGKLRMISCGADKSVYFRTAEQVTSDWSAAAHGLRVCVCVCVGGCLSLPLSVSMVTDRQGFGVYADSPRGQEDHAVRHGRGTHQEVRRRGLSGPQHPVQHTRVCVCVWCSRRIFNISNGKQKKFYKGSQGEDGTLIKVSVSSACLGPSPW